MRTILTVWIVSLLFASIGAAADYFPLKEGNHWSYSMSNGIKMTMTVKEFADVGNVRCAAVETTVGMQSTREYLAADTQGLKAYMAQAQGQEFRYDPPVLRIKLPFVEGQTWTSTMNQYGMPITTTFESLGTEKIQTPAGAFECIKVKSTLTTMPGQPPMVSVSYYAQNMGLVRQTIEMAGQEMVVTLESTNVKPDQQQTPSPRPDSPSQIRCPKCNTLVNATAKFCPQCGAQITLPPAPEVCPKCGAKLPSGAKFCPDCGQKITAAAAATDNTQQNERAGPQGPTLEKYQSQDGKLVLYKPQGWTVHEEDIGEGIRAAYVMEPREDAVVVFMNFPVDEQIKDSVALSAKCLAALGEEFSDLKVTKINSTPERDRTIAEITLTDEGEKGIGHGYFFYTQRIGTVYLLVAREGKWNELRPTLTTVAANLAFAPEGVATVQQQGTQLASQTAVPQGQVLSPAALIRQASQRAGRQVPLQPAALPDQSMSIQIPQGWSLEGQKLQFIVANDPQTRTHGMGYVCHTIIPTNMAMPGVINAPYQPPPQALSLVLESGHTSRNVQVISQCAAEQAVPELVQRIQQMRAQGFQVDARLLHVRLQNVPTGKTLRGVFNVMCSTMSMSPVWQVSVQGSWAPETEYDEWLPLFLRIEKTIQVNQQWMGGEMQNRAFQQQQLNRNLQRSIAESNQAFDGYMDSLQNASRSRDYTSHMWSQTTLGQGTWVAENEGSRVYQTDSWGIEGPEGRLDSSAYNTTNFDGQSPWGGQLEQVDTRAEYEKYIANPN
jgi:RNA polymerase subunit RPABC4/transcription elongation factor Spt4